MSAVIQMARLRVALAALALLMASQPSLTYAAGLSPLKADRSVSIVLDENSTTEQQQGVKTADLVYILPKLSEVSGEMIDYFIIRRDYDCAQRARTRKISVTGFTLTKGAGVSVVGDGQWEKVEPQSVEEAAIYQLCGTGLSGIEIDLVDFIQGYRRSANSH